MDEAKDSLQNYEWPGPEIGSGGFGTVFRSRHKKTGKEVAIKRINKRKLDVEKYKRVVEEVTIHSRCDHPSIIQLNSFFDESGYIHLVLELCHGGELGDYYLRNKRRNLVALDQVRRHLHQIVSGVLYLHKHEVIHRDLSFGNILLTKDNHVKIADFGLATMVQSSKDTHMTFCGTPNFMAPETAAKLGHTKTADVFGIGVILYGMLLGKLPFNHEGDRERTLTNVVLVNPEIPKSLDPAASHLLTWLLKKEPQKRLRLDLILEHPFMSCSKTLEGFVKIYPEYCQASRDNSVDSGVWTTTSSSASAANRRVHPPNGPQPLRAFPHPAQNVSTPVAPALTPHARQHPLSPTMSSQSALATPMTSQHRQTSGHSGTPTRHVTPQMNGRKLDSFHTSTSDDSNKHSLSVAGDAPSARLPTYDPMTYLSEASSRHVEIQARESSSVPQPTERSRSTERSGASKAAGQPLAAPLDTTRLRPIRKAFTSTIVHVLSDGRVVVEIFKPRGQEKRVVKVLYVSTDGQNVVYFQPNGTKGCPVDENNPPLPCSFKAKTFKYSELPPEYNKLYNLAANFITMYRSKTPKFTWYQPNAKVILMEDRRNFVFERYDGAKVSGTCSSAGIGASQVIHSDGTTQSVDDVTQRHLLGANTQQLLNEVDLGLKKTMMLEESDDKMGKLLGNELFPVTRGRRPWKSVSTPPTAAPPDTRSTMQSRFSPTSSVQQSINFQSYEGTVVSSVAASSRAGSSPAQSTLVESGSRRAPRSQSQPPSRAPPSLSHSTSAGSLQQAMTAVVKRSVVPGIGQAKRLKNHTVIAEFEDGDVIEAFGPIKTVRYRDGDGHWTEYAQTMTAPSHVEDKIKKLSYFAEKLV